MPYSQFHVRLRELIDSRGLLMTQLAEAINSTPATISRYVAGLRKPELDKVILLANYFDVSVDWILGLEDTGPSKLPESQKELISLYSMATEEDRKVIQAILSKYRNYQAENKE